MQDFGIPLVNGVLPIVTLLCLSMLTSFLNLKSLHFRTLVCGSPTLIIRDGHLLQRSMARNRFTVDELLEQLRSQGYSDLSRIKYAVLETSGQLSVLPYSEDSPLTSRTLRRGQPDEVTLPILLVSDGRLLKDNLRSSGHDLSWLNAQLASAGASSHRELFLMTVDECGQVTCIKKESCT